MGEERRWMRAAQGGERSSPGGEGGRGLHLGVPAVLDQNRKAGEPWTWEAKAASSPPCRRLGTSPAEEPRGRQGPRICKEAQLFWAPSLMNAKVGAFLCIPSARHQEPLSR